MEYFILKFNSDSDFIGSEFPQIQTIGGSIHRDAPNSIYKVTEKIPDFIPNLNHLVVHPNAKITDFMSASVISLGYIVNERIKKILEHFNLGKHAFYPATLKHNEKSYNNFYWFCFDNKLSENIDYSRTDFFAIDSFNEITAVEVNSRKDLINIQKGIGYSKNIRSTKIHLIKKYPIDIFNIHDYDNRTIISKKMANKFLNEKINPIELIEAKFL